MPTPGYFAETIEVIQKQIQGEQPATAEGIGEEWRKFAALLDDTVTKLQEVKGDLDSWESENAFKAYEKRSDLLVSRLEEGVRAGEGHRRCAYRPRSKMMSEGQKDMQDLYDDYVEAMAAWDAAYERDNENLKYDSMYMQLQESETLAVEREYMGGQTANYAWQRMRSVFKEWWDKEARTLAREIADKYVPALGRLSNAKLPWLLPLEAVAHPSALGMQRPNFGNPRTPGGFRQVVPPSQPGSWDDDRRRQPRPDTSRAADGPTAGRATRPTAGPTAGAATPSNRRCSHPSNRRCSHRSPRRRRRRR